MNAIDVRQPMGWFFSGLGALLAVYGWREPDPLTSLHRHASPGINLACGVVMLAFGLINLAWSRRRRDAGAASEKDLT